MARLFDMAKQSVTGTPGAGTFTLGAVVSGFQTFAAAGVQDGQVVSYSAVDPGGDWEVGRGTYTAAGTTLSRGPLFSSNGGAAVNFTAGTVVWIAVLAEDLIQTVTLAGNTAGATGIVISPNLVLSGGPNVTLSGTSNTIVLSGAAGGGASATSEGWSVIGNTTGLTSSNALSIVSKTLSGAGIVSLGFSNDTVIVSAPAPAASQGSLSWNAVGNTAGSTSSSSSVLPELLALSGAGGVSVGFSNSTIIISGATTAAQSVQTLGLFAVGNTTGTTSSQTLDARTVSFGGAGIASVGFSAGSIIISATSAASATSAGWSAAGNTTGTTSSISRAITGNTVSGGGIVSAGFSGSSLIVSATTSQSAQTLGLFAVGNTTGTTSSETVDARTISFDGAGIASIGFSAGSIIVSASSNQSVQTLGLFAVGNTTGTTSSETVDARTISFDGAGVASVGFSAGSVIISAPAAAAAQSSSFLVGNTTGLVSSQSTVNSLTISGAGIVSVGFSSSTLIISASSTQSVQTLGLFAVGNTTGTTSSETLDARTISFDGAGIVSVGFSAGSVIVSAPSPAASQGSLSWVAIGNTTGVTSSSSSALPEALTLSGAGGVSVGYSNSTVVISGATTAAQSVQTLGLFAVGNTTGTTSSETVDARTISFDGAGVASVGFSGGSVVISAPAAAAAASSYLLVGNTTGLTSSQSTVNSLTISGAGIASVGFSSSTLIISASSSQSVQTLGLFAVGNTAGTTSSQTLDARTVSFDGAGIASVGFSAGSIIVSVPPPAASGTGESRFALGNTTLQSSSAVGTLGSLSVSGAGGVSVGFSTAANSGVLVISGATTVAQSVQTLGLFAVGNTTGTTSSETVDARTISFDGAGIASVGFSAGSIIVSASSSQSVQTLGLFAVGNTTGTTSSETVDARTISFDGAGAASVGFSAGSVIISAAAAAAAASSFFAVGNTAGTTSSVSTSNSLTLSGGGIVSVGYSSTSLIISATTAQSVQTLGLFAVGNTTGTTSSETLDARTISFDGAGIASVGFSAGSIIVSATSAASATSMGFSAAGNTTGTTSSFSTALTGETISGGGIVSVGFSNSSIIISATTAQSAQTLGLFAVGNTTGTTSSETVDARTISFNGAGIASVGFSAGSIIISATSVASATSKGITALGNTTALTSSGSTAITGEQFSGAGIVSVGLSSSTLVISATTSQSAQTLGLFAVGNTTGTTSSETVDARTVSFDGAGNVSVGFSAGSVIISGGAAAGAASSFFAVGNTAGTTSSVSTSNSLTLSGGGIVSVGYSNTSLIISADQSVQTLGLFAVGNTTGTTSSQTLDARTISFDGAGIVSVGYSAGSVIVSATSAAQSVQTLGLFAVGNTTGTTSSQTLDARTISFDGAGAASVGFSAGSIIVSAAAAAAAASSFFAAGNTTGTTSSVSTSNSLTLSGAGIVSVGYSNTSLIISATTAQSVQTLGLFAVGNTAGTTSSQTLDARTISFDGAGIASVGFSAGSIIVSATTAASGSVENMFAVGNTTALSSSTSVTLTNMTISGAGAISVGYSTTGAGAGALVISGPSPGAANMSLFAVGNTTGATSSAVIGGSLTASGSGAMSVGISQSSLIFAIPSTSSLLGTSGISLSTNASTISIMETPLYYFEPVALNQGILVINTGTATSAFASSATATTTTTPFATSLPNGATMFMAPFVLPRPIIFTGADVLGNFPIFGMTMATSTVSSSATGSFASGISAAIYSASSGSYSSLSSITEVISVSQTISRSSGSITQAMTVSFPLSSGTSSISTSSSGTGTQATAAQFISNFSGWREIDVSLSGTLLPGNYIFGIQGTTASGGNNALAYTASLAGNIAINSAVGTIGGTQPVIFPGVGMLSASATSIVPASFNFSSISSTVNNFRLWFQLGN